MIGITFKGKKLGSPEKPGMAVAFMLALTNPAKRQTLKRAAYALGTAVALGLMGMRIMFPPPPTTFEKARHSLFVEPICRDGSFISMPNLSSLDIPDGGSILFENEKFILSLGPTNLLTGKTDLNIARPSLSYHRPKGEDITFVKQIPQCNDALGPLNTGKIPNTRNI